MIFDRWQMGPLRDPVSAITGGVGLLTNVIGGFSQKKTAEKAAAAQAAAAAAAGKKVQDATAAANPAILDAAKNASEGVTAAAGAGANTANTAADRANALLDSYRTSGADAAETLKSGLVPGGDFNKTPTMADIQIDPGYAWRQQQAELALSRGAAARGTVGSGGFQVDLNREVQNNASQEYQKAFDRFRNTTQDRFSNLFKVAGAGQDAAGKQGGNLIDAGQFGSKLMFGASEDSGNWGTGAANLTSANTINATRTSAEYDTDAARATAAGKVAGSNALWGGITGGVNAATGAATRAQNLLRNPAEGVATRGPGVLKQLGVPNIFGGKR